MKVLHLSAAHNWRGGEQQLFYLYQALEEADIKQIIVSPQDSELHKRIVRSEKTSLVEFIKKPFSNIYLALKLKRISKQENIDIIHAHDSNSHTTAFLSALLFGNKTPLIIHRRVAFQNGKGRLSKLKYNHKTVRGIICVSEAVKEVLHDFIDNNRVLSVVHSGIDISRFQHQTKSHPLRELLNLEEDSIIIGNTSAIDSHKDYYTFVDSAAIVIHSNPNVHFVIVGEGPLEHEIKLYIEQKKLTDNFHFTGFRNDIHLLLPCFDIFLMTTINEGLGTSILDAFACKVPVVSTDAGGIPEIIDHKKSGLLAPIGDSKELAKHILHLINDDRLREKIITGANLKLKSFTKDKMCNKIIEIYKGL